MISLIQGEVVTSHKWLSSSEFTDIVAVSQMTPGPIGINSATYIGYVAPQMNSYPHWWWGVLGSIACTVTIIIPSFVLVRRTSHFIARHRESQYIRGAFAGLRPVVVGLIASAALLLMNSANFGSTTRDVCISVAICVATLLIQLFTKLHPIVTICLAGLAGWLIF